MNNGAYMILYKNNNIEISTVNEKDILDIIDLFSSTSFNCDYESGALRPTVNQFKKIIHEIIMGDRENQVLVLKEDNSVIGYLSCFIQYNTLILGHIVVNEKVRNKGYGKLLTSIALELASLGNRRVKLDCYYSEPKYLYELGFRKVGASSYIWEGKIKSNLPNLFESTEEYERNQNEKLKKEMDSWNRFLESDFMKEMSLRQKR